MKKITILTLHGMGETRTDDWTGLAEQLESRLERVVWQSLHIEPIYYQPLLQTNQAALWQRMSAQSLRWQPLRKFVLFGFGDAACLEHQAYLAASVYRQVQASIRDALHHALGQMESAFCPVLVIAQSLGCQVISNYLWDAQKKQGIWQDHPAVGDQTETDFLQLKTTRYLFTTGCNIPLFVSGQAQIAAIARPNAAFEWFNYFDADDTLGWPLKQLSPSYQHIVTADVNINAGNVLTSWNPLCHNAYWTDQDFIEPVANKLRTLHPQVQTPKSPLYKKGDQYVYHT